MRPALLLAAALALPAEAARDCEPNCDMLWAKYTSISVTTMDSGSSAAASWRAQFDHARHDIKIDADFPMPSGRSRGTIVLVGGRVLLSRGMQLPPGQEIDVLDAPILAIQLITAVLGRAVPVAPEAIGKERAFRTREEKVGIRFATPSAAAYLIAPWTAEGKVSKDGNGGILFELHVAGATQEPSGRKGPVIDSRFTGRFSDVPAPRAAIAAMPADDVAFARDALADAKPAHLLAHRLDHADVFVADVHRHRDRLLRPLVPVVDVHVGAADRGLADADEHVVRADRGLGRLGHPDAGLALHLRKRPHCAGSGLLEHFW